LSDLFVRKTVYRFGPNLIDFQIVECLFVVLKKFLPNFLIDYTIED